MSEVVDMNAFVILGIRMILLNPLIYQVLTSPLLSMFVKCVEVCLHLHLFVCFGKPFLFELTIHPSHGGGGGGGVCYRVLCYKNDQ